MLTSLVALLVPTLVSSQWLQFGCWCTFCMVSSVAESVITSIRSPYRHVDTPLATGYFAAPTLGNKVYMLTAFWVSAIVAMLPIIVAGAYQFMYGTSSVEDLTLMVVIAVTCFLSMGSLLALSFVIGPKPLKWNIYVVGSFVILSVESMGTTKDFHNVVKSSKGSLRLGSTPKRSYVTDASQGRVVTVEYVPVKYWNGKAKGENLSVTMTPEDPDLFVDMIAQAIEQSDQSSNSNVSADTSDKIA